MDTETPATYQPIRSPSPPDSNQQSPSDPIPHSQESFVYNNSNTNDPTSDDQNNPDQKPPFSSHNIAGLSSGVFLHFDKKLSDCVKQFPCLYDSKTVGYKDKKTAIKIWEIVAREVEVESGEHAQKLYFNLKKRFHKRRNFLKRLQRSGTTNQILLKKARSDVKVYSFLDWLIPYTQVRQPRVPIKPEEAGILEAKYGASFDIDELDDRPSFIDLHKNYNDVTNHNGSLVYVKQENVEDDSNLVENEDEILTIRPSSPVINQQNLLLHVAPDVDRTRDTAARTFETRVSNDVTTALNSNNVDHVEPSNKRMRQSNSVSSTLNGSIDEYSCNSNNNNKQFADTNGVDGRDMPRSLSQPDFLENEDHLFGLMVGAEMKRFPYREKCIAKLKIQNVLFDIQMSLLQKNTESGSGIKVKSHTI